MAFVGCGGVVKPAGGGCVVGAADLGCLVRGVLGLVVLVACWWCGGLVLPVGMAGESDVLGWVDFGRFGALFTTSGCVMEWMNLRV